MRRRRVWCELLPASELGAASTLALLQRFDIEPLVALPPAREDAALARALGALGRAGVRVGLWPLLPDAEGYWASEGNVEAFVRRVAEVLDFAEKAGARVHTLAVDLEPPLVRHARGDGRLRQRAKAGLGALARYVRTPRAERRQRCRRFAELAADLRSRNIETLAAVSLRVVADLALHTRIWQSLLETPVAGCGWSVVSPMVYPSMLSQKLPGLGPRGAERVVSWAGRSLVRAVGVERACLSLGLTAPGKLGDEPTYASPDELRRDVALARAAGVEDLALFSLEGVLGRGRPEDWLLPFTA